jgi:hypothetical protein
MIKLASRRFGAAAGVIAVGATVAISSFGSVRAERATQASSGIFRCDKGLACVDARSTGLATLGMLGISNSVEGIEGVTFTTSAKAGVRGASRGTAGTGYGVVGTSTNGEGVVGLSSDSASAGIRAINQKGDGIVADAGGVDKAVVRAHAEGSRTAIFVGNNIPNFAHCVIDSNANLSCTGNLRSDAMVESTHRSGSGRRVVAYASESATATIDDVGTGRLVDGVANVRIDPAFAVVTDRDRYYVFLTPLGDTRGLYVSRKAAFGFQVREVEGGKGKLDFDYRIVAHPVDAPDDRLPSAPNDEPRAR